jgi:DNA-binding SARP family transcriptional activator
MDRRANPLQLRLFGGIELRSERAADAPAPGRKVRALLAYLALNVDLPCPREKLMALLWGDRAEEQARASLRQALTELRHALGEPSPLRTDRLNAGPRYRFRWQAVHRRAPAHEHD